MDDSLIDITNADATNLSRTLRQEPDGALSQQLQNEYGMSREEANKVAATSCKSATSYWMLKLNGAVNPDGEGIGSYSEFLRDNVRDGIIKESNGWVGAGLVEKYGFDTKTINNYEEYIGSSEGRFGETRIHVNAKGYDHSIPTYSNSETDTRYIADVGGRGYGGIVNDAIYNKGSIDSKRKNEYFKYYQYLERRKGR